MFPKVSNERCMYFKGFPQMPASRQIFLLYMFSSKSFFIIFQNESDICPFPNEEVDFELPDTYSSFMNEEFPRSTEATFHQNTAGKKFNWDPGKSIVIGLNEFLSTISKLQTATVYCRICPTSHSTSKHKD